MLGSVLIARPNDFVVADTVAGLIRVGFTPSRITTVAELSTELQKPLAGVAVSTAVSSVTGLSIGETVRLVRKINAAVPIIITSLSSVDTARTALKQELGPTIGWPVLDAAAAALDPRLGDPGVLLCITRAALQDGSGDAALRRHLAGRGTPAQ